TATRCAFSPSPPPPPPFSTRNTKEIHGISTANTAGSVGGLERGERIRGLIQTVGCGGRRRAVGGAERE
ncbi:unnamed protein product, partial [Bubo scandiacus]